MRPSNSEPRPTDLQGDYARWGDALAASVGYDNEVILEKTLKAVLRVKNGEAAYERDSVLFDEIEYSWPVLAGVMMAAARCGGNLSVLDFGGSLGSTYFQNRHFLSGLKKVSWNIVEQKRHVEAGRKWLADDTLHFYDDVHECVTESPPDVALLSSVLQYVEYPFEIFSQLLLTSADTIIIDRTPFWSGSTDRLCVQTVPPHFYEASYPSWIFSRSNFESAIPSGWRILARFDSLDRLTAPVDITYEGILLVRGPSSTNAGRSG
jgi:putative methyltransferase (TIGR04325 family)